MKNIICSFILGVMTLSMINAQDPAKDVKKSRPLIRFIPTRYKIK